MNFQTSFGRCNEDQPYFGQITDICAYKSYNVALRNEVTYICIRKKIQNQWEGFPSLDRYPFFNHEEKYQFYLF
jgi:hypothetical protein